MSLRQLVEEERGAARWGRRALIAYGVFALAGLLALVVYYGGSFHTWDHFFHQVVTADRNGRPPPTLPSNLASPLAFYLFSLPELVAEILLLVWQYRAANAARWLGLPAQHRPGWGVGFWFIPVANLFCPYQAIRDCLPPGHPGRPRVLRFWLSLIATQLVLIAGEVSAIFSRPAGIVLLVVGAGCWALVITQGLKVIDSIQASHRQIVGI